MNLRFGIVGAGLVGGKRASALQRAQCPILAVYDSNDERARALATSFGAVAAPTLEVVLETKDIDAIVISTSNESCVDVALRALQYGKHILVEKPAGRNPFDLSRLSDASKHSRRIVRIGFNHRFHPAIEKAKSIFDSGAIGPLMYIRSRYGHGGRLGYDREWRADPKKSGGGELLDQGIHLIDLCRFFGGEFGFDFGRVGTFFWDMKVEDNGFLLLRSLTTGAPAFLHASCTEWKNLFDFEVFGTKGKLQIVGLGGSYGTEEFRFFRMKPEMGPPDSEVQSFAEPDYSWDKELSAFCLEINGEATAIGQVDDAKKAMEIVYQAYRAARMEWA